MSFFFSNLNRAGRVPRIEPHSTEYPFLVSQHSSAQHSLQNFQHQSQGSSGFGYTCLYPRCHSQFVNDRLLDQHVRGHFMNSFQPHPTTTECSQSKPYNSPTDGSLPGDCFAKTIGGIQSPSVENSVEPVSLPDSGIVFQQWDPKMSSRTFSEISEPKEFACPHEGCAKGYGRMSDLNRHKKTHQTGPKTFNCIALRCPRKGAKGFWRLDKLRDHIDARHPEVEYENFWRWPYNSVAYWFGGIREKNCIAEHEAEMLRIGYKPKHPGSVYFRHINDPTYSRNA